MAQWTLRKIIYKKCFNWTVSWTKALEDIPSATSTVKDSIVFKPKDARKLLKKLKPDKATEKVWHNGLCAKLYIKMLQLDCFLGQRRSRRLGEDSR